TPGTTRAAGNVAFTSTLSAAVPTGQYVTAAATESGNNTSEFSTAVRVSGSAAHGVARSRSATEPSWPTSENPGAWPAPDRRSAGAGPRPLTATDDPRAAPGRAAAPAPLVQPGTPI